MSRLTFRDTGTSLSGLTRLWRVENGPCILGQIHWFAQWRRYTFSPIQGSTFDASCLEEIAIFLGAETTRHKA